MDKKIVGERIMLSRRRLINQRELAERVGLTQSRISAYENGGVKSLDLDVIEKIAQVLDVSPQYLVGWDDDPLAGMDESVFSVVRDETRTISEWPLNVQELAELASQLPDGMVESLIALARQCVEVRQSDRERIVFGLVEASRHTFGDTVADQLKAFALGAVDDMR